MSDEKAVLRREILKEMLIAAWRDGFYEGASVGDDLIGGTVETWAEKYAERELSDGPQEQE